MPSTRRNRRWLNSALALAAAVGLSSFPARAQKSPEETRKSLQVADGLAVQVFASEPMFANPCDMDVDSKGRVWITEGWNYRASKLRPEGDRIVVMEDSDGDGVADKAHTFYQGPEINSALGICVLGDKVIVSCAPNVFVFEDKDGDLKADGKPTVLFTGISGVQHDHAIHTFNFGPDGKLYFNFGNEGKQLKDAGGKQIVDVYGNEVANNNKPYRQGMVFRSNLDGSGLETLAWNFRNNYEVAVDSFGTMWQSDNDDDGNRAVRINYVMEFGNYGFNDEATNGGWQDEWRRAQARGASETEKPSWHWHQFDPGVVPNLLQTGAGSPTGICVYEGKLLPKTFWNQVIHCDAGPNVVRAYPVQNDGAGYKAEIVNVLQGGSDKWFRPSDVCVAPDGSLMVADWYDPGVGGHATGDKNIQTIKGRVYRMAPPNAKYTIPKLDLSTAAGACESLKSPNNATRYLAWTKLHEMGQGAEAELTKLWQDQSEPRIRARALHLLARIKGSEQKYVSAAVADKDSDIRITALRIARERKLDLLPVLKQLSKDGSPQVRREAAIALRGNRTPEAVNLWAELAGQHTAGDRWELEALGIAANGNDDACFAAWQKKVGGNWNTPGGRDIVWRLRSAPCARLLARIILDKSTPPEELWHYFRAFDFLPADARNEALLVTLNGAAGNRTVVVESLARLKNLDPAKQAQVKQMVGKLLDETKGTAEFVRLCEQFDVKDRSQELLAYAMANPTDVSTGAAIRVVVKNDPKSLDKALAGPDSAKLATALAAASNDRNIVTLLTKIVEDPKRDVPARQAAVSTLTKSKPGCRALLDLAVQKKLPEDLTPLAASLLHNTSHRDIRDDAARILPVPSAKGSEKLPPIEKLLTLKGNVGHGKQVFVSATCSTCHIVNGQGTLYGPELSEIGTKLPKDALYTSILYPNAGISVGFEGSIISTKDGDDLDGIIVSETPDQITLRRAGGVNTAIKKSEIKERRAMKLSIMPENLQQQMTTQDLVDLVEYLGTLKKAQPAK
jgi:putative membrane-bound dehydrogenase-like protein